jgi:hypothetical protein
MRTFRKIREKLLRTWRVDDRAETPRTIPAMEIVYRELFLRDLGRLRIDDVFYPVGSAANHSLLYLVTRCFVELEIQNAIELGAGQTSILLSRLNGSRNNRTSIRTVEHDVAWAEVVRPQIRHDLVVSPLAERRVDAYSIKHYASDYFERSIKYDFLLVDGPPANTKENSMNRLGAIELVRTNLGTNFVLIVDDAERPGEGMLIDAIRRELAKLGTIVQEGAVTAMKRQHIFAAGSYSRAAYF